MPGLERGKPLIHCMFQSFLNSVQSRNVCNIELFSRVFVVVCVRVLVRFVVLTTGYDMDVDGIRYLQAALGTPAERTWGGSIVTLGDFPQERRQLLLLT